MWNKKLPNLILSFFLFSLSVSGLVIAMLVSMLFLLLLRFTAPVMVWVLIVGLLGAGAYGELQPWRATIPVRPSLDTQAAPPSGVYTS